MTENADRVGVVLMAYGTPRTAAEVESYSTDIRRGHAPTPEALADLVARYDAIGGLSPLAKLTEDQRDGLQAALDEIEPDRFHVALGLKHADPKIEVTSAELARAGFSELIGLVLAPHFSSSSSAEYVDRIRQGVTEAGTQTPVVGVESWATEPAFIDFLASDLKERLATMRADVEGSVRVVFTADALPQRIIDDGDPYPDEVRSTAAAVAAKLGLIEGDDWSIAWQPDDRTPEAWIGPDILEVIEDLGPGTDETRSVNPVGGVIVCAVGFVADHLDVLFDIDIEAAQRADQVGLAFDRTACVNDEPSVMAALAHRVADLA